MRLGAGRKRKEDSIDPSAGIYMHKSVGDSAAGLLCTLYTNKADCLDEAAKAVRRAITVGKEKPAEKSIIIDTVE